MGAKENVFRVITIFNYDMEGDNMKVSTGVVVDGDCFVPVPAREGVNVIFREVGSYLLWPCHLVIP